MDLLRVGYFWFKLHALLLMRRNAGNSNLCRSRPEHEQRGWRNQAGVSACWARTSLAPTLCSHRKHQENSKGGWRGLGEGGWGYNEEMAAATGKRWPTLLLSESREARRVSFCSGKEKELAQNKRERVREWQQGKLMPTAPWHNRTYVDTATQRKGVSPGASNVSLPLLGYKQILYLMSRSTVWTEKPQWT